MPPPLPIILLVGVQLVALAPLAAATTCTGLTYSYGSGACAPCSTGATFVSSSAGCQPSALLTAGPADTSFYLSGTSIEGDAAFSTVAQPAGIAFVSSVFGAAGGALNLSASSYLATTPDVGSALALALPGGNNESVSLSAWIKCPASAVPSVGLVSSVLSWGAPGSVASGKTSQLQIGLAVRAGTAGAPAMVTQEGAISTYGPNGGFHPQFLALVGTSIVFSDSLSSSIRVLFPNGTLSTLATGFGFNPMGVAFDSTTGNAIVADFSNNCIKSVTPAGAVTIIAGSASGQPGSSDGAGTNARFLCPAGVAVSSAGLIAVADALNFLIRLISGGLTTTLAGSSTNDASQDGTGSGAYFNTPFGVAFDGEGNVIVADSACIRKVTPQGVTTTVAGWNTGFADGLGTSASFLSPLGIAVDVQGNILVSDNYRIRKVSPLGLVTTIAGTGANANGSPVDGAALNATFSDPRGVAIDSSGRIFVADSNCIRLLSVSATAFSNVCDSTWHHLALTSNASSITLSAYIDGALSLQTQFSFAFPAAGSSTLSIGWSGNLSDGASGSLFARALSELRIYKRSLSPAEVLALSQPPLLSVAFSTHSPPAPTLGATSYAWFCLPGYFNAAASTTFYDSAALVQSPLDRSWTWSPSLAPSCQPCAQGFFALAGAASCTPCAAGFSSSVGASSCYASSAVVGEQTCSAASQAIPPASGLVLLPAAANSQGVDLIVASNATCAARAAAGALVVHQCNMSTYFLASDNATELFVVGTAASMNMRASEQLLCTDTAAVTLSASSGFAGGAAGPVVGLATIPASATSVAVADARITASSFVMVTATGAPLAASVTNEASIGFVITIAAAVSTAQVFRYFIVQY